MDLSKALDTINHELLDALKDALKLIHIYISDLWQRVNIDKSFSSWSNLLNGVPPGSVSRPLLFNINLNDTFYMQFPR